MPRPKLRTPELKAQVLEVALQLLEEEGVQGFKARTLAQRAGTSLPAVYELFGDKAGIVRALFFEGFARLGERMTAIGDSGAPLSDLRALFAALRGFLCQHPQLSDVMFSRPFADFRPTAEEQQAGDTVRCCVVGRVQACIDAGVIAGDATDLAHVILAQAQGLMGQERAGWLGRTPESIQRRWDLAFDALIHGVKR